MKIKLHCVIFLYKNPKRFYYKSAKWHCGRHTLICKKILIKKT